MSIKKGTALEFYFRRLSVTRSPEIDQGSDQQVDFYFGRLMVRTIKESKRDCLRWMDPGKNDEFRLDA